ncbi:hypothetical protein MP638_006294 [Amoeboaphelidium occidentale]|nr:hypothetical protein MP638_006294 [Amoeboaphelidium occidentale]
MISNILFLATLAVYTQAQQQGSNLLDQLRNFGEYNTFVSLLQSTGLANELQGQGNITILAPKDSAFQQFPLVLQVISNPQLSPVLKEVLNYHIVNGRYNSSVIQQNRTLAANSKLQGLPVIFSARDQDQLFANEAQIVDPDLQTRAQGGQGGQGGRVSQNQQDQSQNIPVVHGIDSVLSPLYPFAGVGLKNITSARLPVSIPLLGRWA